MSKCRNIRRSGGFTLVEIMVSAMIIVLAAVLLITVFSGSLRILQRSHDKNTSIDRLYTLLEHGEITASVPGSVTVDGASVPGRFVTVTDEDGLSFSCFIPE